MELKKYQILYVDDERSNLSSFKNLFRRNYKIFIAESGQEGLEIIKNNEIHLVITDQRMPEMTGTEFIGEAKKLIPDSPFILLTGYTDHEVLKEAVNEIGIFRYMNKPFNKDSMTAVIELSLEAFELQRSMVSLNRDLAISQERLSKIAETAIDAIITFREDQTVINANASAAKMFGYSKEELNQLHLKDLIPQDDENVDSKYLDNFSKSERYADIGTERAELLGVKSNGENFPVEVALSKMEFDDEVFINAIVRDISERVEAERQLRESEEKFKGIFNSIVDVFISVAADGTIIMASPSVESLMGYTSDEIAGMETRDTYAEPSDRNLLIEEINRAGYCFDFETHLLTKTGEKRLVSVNAKGFFDRDGKLVKIESLLRDITAKRKIEDQLKESERAFTKRLEQKVEERTAELKKTQDELSVALEKEKELGDLKSTFVSTVSHQFRTPLTVIQTSMAVLKMQMKEANEEQLQKVDAAYEKIKIQIGRMTELMDDVLILGKVNLAKVEPDFQPTDLVELCKDVAQNYDETQLDGRKVDFRIEGEQFMVNIDKKLLNHAVSNLLSNAFKYSKERPAPILKLDFKTDKVYLSVKDHGIGIPENDIKHLFEPFYRASNVKDIAGTGLGIAIAKEYTELNRGSLTVESKSNEGTTFTIELNR